METNYHTQHSPFGAFASFTIGLHDSPGGFGQSLSGPAGQNVYVGYRTGRGGAWRLLPFFKPPESMLATFAAEGQAAKGKEDVGYEVIRPAEFRRELGWASDRWTAGPLTFCLYSPFGRVGDPREMDADAARFHFAPLVPAAIEFDNSAGKQDAEVLFGLGENPFPPRTLQPLRPLADTRPSLAGFAGGRAYGCAALPGEGVRTVQEMDIFKRQFHDPQGIHRLGHQAAILLSVPAGTKKRLPLALGFHRAGLVTTGLDCSFYYARFFQRLEDVLEHGLKHFDRYVRLAEQRDRELRAGGLSEDQQFLLAQATHSYLGSTELLDRGGQPLWIVNEGEYRMMNTFDLTVDHLFFELDWWPWAMRNALDLFVERYSYRAGVHDRSGRTGPGGISFTHDVGVDDHFSPPGWSSYECTDLTGCFSHMTCEQLVNWICCAVTYAQKTGDRAWLTSRGAVLAECAESLANRDHPDPARRDGLTKWDSDRCGPKGAEITTFDSLDASLGQARNNLYLASKTLAAWLLLERAFEELGQADRAGEARAAADRLARGLEGKFEEDTGLFPAVFEGGNRSRILQAVEGLIFPLYLGMKDALRRDGRFGRLLDQLGRHMAGALRRGVCLDEQSGGWKISSTSFNTWFSKIAIAQHVTRRLFPEAISPEAAAADAVHVRWQSTPVCGAMAMCDQIDSRTGQAIGSRYYPRGVTAWLWMLP